MGICVTMALYVSTLDLVQLCLWGHLHMIIIGADLSSRKDDSTEAGGRSRSTSGLAAQLMVFINGMILSVTAFFIFSYFVKDIVTNEFKQDVRVFESTLSDRLSDVEASIRSSSLVLGYSEAETFSKILESVPGFFNNQSNLDYIIWLSRQEGMPWRKTILYKNQDIPSELYAFASDTLDEDIGNMATRLSAGKKEVVIASEVPGTRYIQKSYAPLIMDRPIAVIGQVNKQGSVVGYLIAVTHVSRLIGSDFSSQRSMVSKVSLQDTLTGKRIYLQKWDGGNDRFDEDVSDDHGVVEQISAGDSPLEMRFTFGPSGKKALFEKMPYLMLLFGVAFTIVGTMYVRSNQKQAIKLSAMNKVLSQKNFEMNAEIVERERLNNSIRKSEREHRAIVNAVSDVIFEITTNGKIVFLNETWKKVTGFEVSKCVGLDIFDMIHPQDQAEQRAVFQMLVRGQKSAYRTPARLRTQDGSYRSVDISISMLRQGENKEMCAVGTVTDIEERRRAERALSEAEKKYRTIVENAAGGIYQLSLNGNYISANPAMARILGYDSAESLLSDISDAHSQVYIETREHGHFIRELNQGNIVKNFETRVRKKNGSEIWVNENARAVTDDNGGVLYYEGSMEDISQRKHAEGELHEAKIESDLANRSKSEFLANMSHELRTPLNAIIGFSEIIKNEVFGSIEQRQYWEYANDIYDSGKHLLLIINSILDIARIEAGERQLNEAVVSIDKVMQSCLDLIMGKIESSGVILINQSEGSGLSVIGEEVALKQIFMNILSNAVKFTPESGRITISHRTDDRGNLHISVTDTGVGMDKNEVEKALTPFGQVDSSLNRTTSGAGLGLTLVNALMNLHGGSLEIFSQKGIGTTVTLVFPAKRVEGQV